MFKYLSWRNIGKANWSSCQITLRLYRSENDASSRKSGESIKNIDLNSERFVRCGSAALWKVGKSAWKMCSEKCDITNNNYTLNGFSVHSLLLAPTKPYTTSQQWVDKPVVLVLVIKLKNVSRSMRRGKQHRPEDSVTVIWVAVQYLYKEGKLKHR